MIELIIAIALIAAILFYLKIKKKKSDATSEPAKPTETKPVEKVVTPTESSTPPANQQTTTAAKTLEHEQVKPARQVVETINTNLPQDSTLRRHYLTHLRAIITSINPPRPADTTLARHYDAQIAAQLEQSLSSKDAIQQLIADYENHKKTPAPIAVVEKSQTIDAPVIKEEQAIVTPSAKPEISNKTVTRKASKIPEDSLLRRHYLTHLYSQVAANLPPRPTDSTLRRHHDSLLENEVKSRLAN